MTIVNGKNVTKLYMGGEQFIHVGQVLQLTQKVSIRNQPDEGAQGTGFTDRVVVMGQKIHNVQGNWYIVSEVGDKGSVGFVNEKYVKQGGYRNTLCYVLPPRKAVA